MTPDLVIFDCDGVLVDTESVTNQILSDNLARYGLTVAPARCHMLFSGGTMKGAMAEAQKMGADLPKAWLDIIYAEMFAALRQGVRVIDGIPELLSRLDAAAVPDCIASNGPPEKMRISLGPSGMWRRFEDRIWSPHVQGPAKPDPALLLMAADHFGVAPARCVMIDDSPAGVIAAQKAGMRAIGFDEAGSTAGAGRVDNLGAEVVTEISQLQVLLGLD